jgi:hypothetical protein
MTPWSLIGSSGFGRESSRSAFRRKRPSTTLNMDELPDPTVYPEKGRAQVEKPNYRHRLTLRPRCQRLPVSLEIELPDN